MPEKKGPINNRIKVDNLKRAAGVRVLVKEKLDSGCMPGKNAEIGAVFSGGGACRITMSGVD